MSKIQSMLKMGPSAWRAKMVWLMYQVTGFWWKRKRSGFFKVKHGQLFLEPSEGLRTYFRACDAWEPDVRDKLYRELREGDIVLDFGSNYGEFALQMADLVGKNGKIIGIEMDSHYFLLEEMVRAYNPALRDRMLFLNAKLSSENNLEWIHKKSKVIPTFYFSDIEGDEKILVDQLISNPKWTKNAPRLLLELHPEIYGMEMQQSIIDKLASAGYAMEKVDSKHYFFTKKKG